MLDVVAWLGELPPALVYVVAAALVFAETGLLIGLVLPGEVTLIFVGFLCSLGTLDPYVAAAILIVAARGRRRRRLHHGPPVRAPARGVPPRAVGR